MHLKERIKRHWPRLRLRTLVFATLFFVAALPGVAAMFLRVYENTLVRQTESELVAQGAALAGAAQQAWPDQSNAAPINQAEFHPEPPSIHLNAATVLPERPEPDCTSGALSPFPLLAAVKTAQRLAPVIAVTRRTTLASVVLLNARGQVAVGLQANCDYHFLPEVARALSGRPATVIRRNGAYRQVYAFEWLSRAAAIRVHHARPIVVGNQVVGVLLLSRSARSLFKGMYEDRGKIAVGIGAIFAALVVLSGLLSRGVTRPIERLGAATRAVAAGRGAVPDAPATAAIEIQGLYADFATMAAAIERRSRYLRDVAYAVSHEFKTPLAAIRGAVELMQDHPEMTGDERRRFLANARADAERLAQLVTRLLDLARADMTEAAPDAVTMLAPVITRVADAAAEGIAIDVRLPAGLPAAAVAAASLEAVLATLVDNSRQAGATRVTITADRDVTAVTLCVADDGPGIAPADRVRLFEPFFTTRRAAGGTGLGLTIARSLLTASGAEIDVVDREGGAAFELRLPAAQMPSVTTA